MRDEMPPVWMWPFEDEITRWFDDVEAARDERWGRSSDRDDDETVPLMGNEIAREIKKQK